MVPAPMRGEAEDMLEPTCHHLIKTLGYLAGVLHLPLATVVGGVAVLVASGLVVLGLSCWRRSRNRLAPQVARQDGRLCPPSKTSLPATAATVLAAPVSPATHLS